jgi:DNA (cytosine-5)-methyltransferase 1
MGHTNRAGLEGQRRDGRNGHEPGRVGADAAGSVAAAGTWGDLVWLPCRDGKARPTQPGLFPLAHGVSARMGRLCGYGNAIVPQVAAAFLQAYRDAREG